MVVVCRYSLHNATNAKAGVSSCKRIFTAGEFFLEQWTT